MAFQFVPNSDGSFTEGDKQTNPESGVEYIYHDGAWRHLGAKIEDEFDTLDERYLKNEGNNELITETNWKLIQDGKTLIQGKGGELGLYNLKEPAKPHHAATKSYVDASGGGIPVGSIMMWINSIAPPGWLKLKGGSFDVNLYPLLDAYLQLSQGYTSGKLPDWRGHYPGQLGDHLNGDVGIKLGQRTAKPSGGSPKSSHKFNDGHTDTANKAGGTNFADIDTKQVVIDSGWDDVTRPKTVAVHFIIKHD